MRQFILSLFLVPIMSNAMATGPGDGDGCRKFEEGLYLRSALRDKGGVTRYLDSLRNCGNDSPSTLLAVGRYLYNQSDLVGAEEALARLTSDRSATVAQLGEAYYYRGMVAFDQRNYLRAMEHTQNAIDNKFKLHWCYNNLGRSLEKLKRYNEALSQYDRSLEYKPFYAVAVNNKGVVYDRLNDYEAAIRYYLMADSLDKGRTALYRSNLTRAYRDARDYDSELVSAAIGLEKFPEDKRILKDYSTAIGRSGHYQEALAIGRKLLGMRPTTVDDWFDLGYIYSQTGVPDSSAAFYNIVLKKDPDHENANHNIARYYRRFGQFEKAHYHLDRVLAVNPNHEDAISTKGITLNWQLKFEESHKWKVMYNEKFPNGDENHLAMGYSLMLLGRYSEAIPWLEEQLKRKPNDDRSINNMGRCYGKLGDSQRALDLFQQALAINPDNSFIFHNRASVYADLKEFDLACNDLQTAIDKQYNWVIDSSLLSMRNVHCPQVITDRKVVIYEYAGNAKELKGRSFIELLDTMAQNIETSALINVHEELNVPADVANTSTTQSAFQVYPNPSAGIFTVEGTSLEKTNHYVKVFDVQGRTIAQLPMNQNRLQLDLSAQGPGTYLVMVMDDGAVLSTRKVIVQ